MAVAPEICRVYIAFAINDYNEQWPPAHMQIELVAEMQN